MKLYKGFCQYFKIQESPATTDHLTRFAEFLSRKFQDADSVRAYISGIKFWHIWQGHDTQAFQHKSIEWMIKGIARKKQHIPKQVLPIDIGILKKFREHLDLRAQEDRTYWALFLLAFFLMARKSNLVPDTEKGFDGKKQLVKKDIMVTDRALLVTIKWSKTIQFGKREHVVPILATGGNDLCPVRAYREMAQGQKEGGNHPVFTILTKGKRKIVTYRNYQNKIKQLITKIGLNPIQYSSHSFRRGGASHASSAGVPYEMIKLMGDWKSDSVQRYIQYSLEQKTMAARQIADHII